MRKVFILIFVLITQISYSQVCGTIATKEQIDFMDSFRGNSSSTGRSNSITVKIPIQFHSVTRDDGTGGLTNSQANNILSNLNSYYSNSNIEFFFNSDINYIPNSEEYDWTGSEGAVAASNDVGGVINIYFFNSINSNGTPLCGYTRFPPSSDRVFVRYDCVIGGTTLEHELGHYFTLYHTHGTTNTGTTDELVDGSNCSSAGDRLCDTPADPNLSGNVNNCIYIGTATDANGDLYNPQVENIMSYAPDECTDLFTAGQYDRIRNGFENGRVYLNWISDDFTANFTASSREICNGNEIDFKGIGFGVSSWQWEFEGGTPATSQVQNPKVTYENGGIFDVKLTVESAGGAQVIVNKNNYVNVIDPLVNSVKDSLNFDFNGDLSELDLSNPDQAFTFEKSTVDKNGNIGSGSIYINNFDYQTEVPGVVDKFSPKTLNTAGVNKYIIKFDYAYTYRPGPVLDTYLYDSLLIKFNTGCLVKDDVLWSKGGLSLSSAEFTENPFEPSGESEWKSAEFEYQLSGEETAIFKFENHSYNGNNLYIDNLQIIPDLTLKAPELFRIVEYKNNKLIIRWVDASFNELKYVLLKSKDGSNFERIELNKDVQIYEDADITEGSKYDYKLFAEGRNGYTSDTVGVISYDNTITSVIESDILIDDGVKVFPNPTLALINVESGYSIIKSIQIINSLGQVVVKRAVNSNYLSQNLSEQESGLYLIKIELENKSLTKRIVIE